MSITPTPLPVEENSQTLAGGCEITMLMPIKPGFVDHRDTISYALRLRRVLRTFNGLRKASLESTPDDTVVGAVERIQTVTSFNWAVVENQTKLLLSVVFDRPWEPYIRKIARDAGPMLDLILCHCTGYVEGNYSTDKGYRRFAEWVRKYQVGVDFLYTSHSVSTIDDQNYYDELDALLHRELKERLEEDDPRKFDLAAAGLQPRSPANRAKSRAAANPQAYARQLAGIIGAFYAWREQFPGVVEQASDKKEQWFLKRVARALVLPIPPEIEEALDRVIHSELEWLREFKEESPPVQPKEPDWPNIQGDILYAYKGTTHGALLLIRLGESLDESRKFLDGLPVTTASDVQNGEPEKTLNLFFTIDGLRRLGLPADWIARLPKEFRDGMEARAGLLGDVRVNHPRNWALPVGTTTGGAKFRVPMQSVDVAVLLQHTANEGDLEQWVAEISGLVQKANAAVLVVERMYRKRQGNGGAMVEHFGFRDGISNPVPTAQEPVKQNEVRVGELLLGYPNRYGDPADERDQPLKDGSFMVVRKLEQHTGAFKKVMDDFTGKYSEAEAAVAKAKLVGRKTDGTPLVHGIAAVQEGNDFNFCKDPTGALCPFQSHMRRTNPRNAAADDPDPVPRIARRGFTYGPADPAAEGERGLMFLAYNASIAEQFEIIQRWISGGNSTGIPSRESDPLLGLPKPGQRRSMRFLHDGEVYRIDLGSKPLVTLKWGLYLFCPSISVIKAIASGALQEDPTQSMAAIEAKGARTIMNLNMPSPDTAIPEGASTGVIAMRTADIIAALSREGRDALAARGLAHLSADGRAALLAKGVERLSANDIGSLSPEDIDALAQSVIAIRTAEVIAYRWKNFLESDLGPHASLVNAVWAAIRKHHKGVLRTPYGVLVAGADQVKEVLADKGERFSVRENWDRMQGSIVETYLGFDKQSAAMHGGSGKDQELEQRYLKACPPEKLRYDEETALSKPSVAQITFQEAFDESLALAKAWILKRLSGPPAPIRVPELFGDVLAQLATKWFGMPDSAEMVASVTAEGAQKKAACPFHFFAVSKYVFPPRPTKYVKDQATEHGNLIKNAVEKFVATALSEQKKPGELLSAVYGTRQHDLISRTIITMLNGFMAPTFANFLTIMNRWIEFKELAWEYHRYTLSGGQVDVLEESLKRALLVKCTPSTVNRTVLQDATLRGGVKLVPGEQLVVGLQSAVDERRFAGTGGLEFVFGGNFRDASSNPPLVHACPGQEMAIGVMAGTVGAIFDTHLIGEAPMPLTLVPNPPPQA